MYAIAHPCHLILNQLGRRPTLGLGSGKLVSKIHPIREKLKWHITSVWDARKIMFFL